MGVDKSKIVVMPLDSHLLRYYRKCLAGTNPLVRRTDRIEAAAVVVSILFAVMILPFAAAAGTAIHDVLSHKFADAQLTRHQVEATVSADSRDAPDLYSLPYLTDIRWEFRGSAHSEVVRTARLAAGDHLTLWVDGAGERTMRPPSTEDAAVQAVVAAAGLWLATVAVACLALVVLRHRLNHARSVAWDSDLDDLVDRR